MALDRDMVESARKWITTFATGITVVFIPLATMAFKAHDLQMKQEIDDKYVPRAVYQADIAELKTIVKEMRAQVEATHEDVAVIRSQLAKP